MNHNWLKRVVISATLILVPLTVVITGCVNHQGNQTPAVKQRFNNIELWVKIFEDPERDKWQIKIVFLKIFF